MQAKRNSHLDGCDRRRHMNVISNKTKQSQKTELNVFNYSLLLLPTRSIEISQNKRNELSLEKTNSLNHERSNLSVNTL